MEHSCQHCGIPVEDGRPFCPQCRAPQIHVQLAAPDGASAASLNSAPDELSHAAPQEGPFDRAGDRLGMMNRKIAVRSALMAGVLGVFIGIIPFVGIMLTGALAVYFYRRSSKFALPTALGARLGGAAGIVVFAINALFTIPIIVFHAQQECADSIVEIARKYGINTDTPQFQASIHSLFTPSGLAAFFVVALILSSAGGALASLLLSPRNPRM